MDRLRETLIEVMSGYAVKGLNGSSYLTHDALEEMFVVITIGAIKGKHFTNTNLIVQVIADVIVIELDINNKPLVDALVQAGIPREKIILAYQGETLPETAQET